MSESLKPYRTTRENGYNVHRKISKITIRPSENNQSENRAYNENSLNASSINGNMRIAHLKIQSHFDELSNTKDKSQNTVIHNKIESKPYKLSVQESNDQIPLNQYDVHLINTTENHEKSLKKENFIIGSIRLVNEEEKVDLESIYEIDKTDKQGFKMRYKQDSIRKVEDCASSSNRHMEIDHIKMVDNYEGSVRSDSVIKKEDWHDNHTGPVYTSVTETGIRKDDINNLESFNRRILDKQKKIIRISSINESTDMTAPKPDNFKENRHLVIDHITMVNDDNESIKSDSVIMEEEWTEYEKIPIHNPQHEMIENTNLKYEQNILNKHLLNGNPIIENKILSKRPDQHIYRSTIERESIKNYHNNNLEIRYNGDVLEDKRSSKILSGNEFQYIGDKPLKNSTHHEHLVTSQIQMINDSTELNQLQIKPTEQQNDHRSSEIETNEFYDKHFEDFIHAKITEHENKSPITLVNESQVIQVQVDKYPKGRQIMNEHTKMINDDSTSVRSDSVITKEEWVEYRNEPIENSVSEIVTMDDHSPMYSSLIEMETQSKSKFEIEKMENSLMNKTDLSMKSNSFVLVDGSSKSETENTHFPTIQNVDHSSINNYNNALNWSDHYSYHYESPTKMEKLRELPSTTKQSKLNIKDSITQQQKNVLPSTDCLKQSLHVDHEDEEILHIPTIYDAQGELIKNLSETQNFKSVTEYVTLQICGTKALVKIEIGVEMFHNYKLENETWKRKNVTVTRMIELDLFKVKDSKTLQNINGRCNLNQSLISWTDETGNLVSQYNKVNKLTGRDTFFVFSNLLDITRKEEEISIAHNKNDTYLTNGPEDLNSRVSCEPRYLMSNFEENEKPYLYY